MNLNDRRAQYFISEVRSAHRNISDLDLDDKLKGLDEDTYKKMMQITSSLIALEGQMRDQQRVVERDRILSGDKEYE